ncbi:hypothetical protein [Pseudonocardia nigra]|uniref:hypothetical protein n=1 Tax=Pseudonocardia nigra TaxID=1921578 RepID=UPI001C5E6487|nr:hypothetical protein [Pseudonocardia nigra]
MAATIARPSRDRLARSEPFEVFTRPQRSWPARVFGLIVRLRAEITTAVVVLSVWAWVAGRLRALAGDPVPVGLADPPLSWWALHWPGAVAAALLLVVLVVVAVVPASRRLVQRRALAVLTRHRLRAVFVQCRVMNWTGNLPLLLWARPTAVGERVWVLLRVGIDGVDVERALGHIAAGCFARDARVTVVRSMTALVAVEVIRRDPLAGTAHTSPHAAALPVARPAAPPARQRRLVPVRGGQGA